VHAVARQYFRLPDEDERLRVVIGDGAAFVEQDDSQWDLIAVDGFDSNARAGALRPAFYEACRARLSDGWAAVVNLFGQLRGFKTQLQRSTRPSTAGCWRCRGAPAATWWPLRPPAAGRTEPCHPAGAGEGAEGCDGA
jgi:spermidine synthase